MSGTMKGLALVLGFLSWSVVASNADGRVQLRGVQKLAADTTKNSTQSALAATAELKGNERTEAARLFHFLVDLHGPAPNKEQFLAECLEHLHGFVHSLDHSYSDVQFVHMLKHACDEFPGHDALNFDHQKGCDHFSERLIAARHHELANNGEITEYQVLCKDYYETEVCDRHDCEDGDKKMKKKGKIEAAVEEVEEAVEESVAPPNKCWLLLVAFMLSCCLGGYGAHKKHITGIIAVVVFVVSFVYICFFTNLMNRFFHNWAMSWTCWFLCLFVVVQGITYLAYFVTMGLAKAGIIKNEGIKSRF